MDNTMTVVACFSLLFWFWVASQSHYILRELLHDWAHIGRGTRITVTPVHKNIHSHQELYNRIKSNIKI